LSEKNSEEVKPNSTEIVLGWVRFTRGFNILGPIGLIGFCFQGES
jgi:hypothetical protein